MSNGGYVPDNSLMTQRSMPVENMSQNLSFGDRSDDYQQQQQLQQQQQRQVEEQPRQVDENVSSSSNAPIGDIVSRMHDTNTLTTRRFHFDIDGSPNDFHNGNKEPTFRLSNKHAIQYSIGSERGAKRTGDPTKAIILGARIVSAKNNYPFDVMICSDLKSNLYTNTGQRGISIVHSDETVHDKPFYHASENIYNPIVSTYSNIKQENLLAPQISVPKRGQMRLVETASYLGDVVKLNSKTQDYTIGPTNKFDIIDGGIGHLYTPEHVYLEAVSALDNQVIKQMPYHSLLGLEFNLVRPGTNWVGDSGLTKYNNNSSIKSQILKTSSNVSGEIEITYRLEGNGDLNTSKK